MKTTHILTMLVVTTALFTGHATGAVVTIDNVDPEVSYTGTWPTSVFSSDRIGANYQHSNQTPGITATYTPDLTAGLWEVEAFWNASSGRGDDVPYTITYNGGSTTVNRDQRANGNQWNSLGTYQFAAGTGGNVQISSTVNNGQYVIADAMRFTSVPTNNLLNTDADSYVQAGSPTSNYGTGTQLMVKLDDGGSYHRKTYMRYDLSTLSFDHTSELQSASLDINFIDSGAGAIGAIHTWEFEVFGLDDGDAGENWSETGITWNNAPANSTGSGNGLLANATSLGTFSVTDEGVGLVSFQSAAMDTFISNSVADDFVTFIIVRNTAGAGSATYVHSIAADEHASIAGAQLNLIPEPGTVLLVSVGLATLCLRRRRREIGK